MSESLNINQLIEKAAEMNEAEAKAVYLEVARRFRQGIGVETDAEEAEYWERQAGAGVAVQPQKEAEADPPVELPDWNLYVYMTATEAYRAYQDKNPGGMYGYAMQLKRNGELRDSTKVLEELVSLLEQRIEREGVSALDMMLLGKAKTILAKNYHEQKSHREAIRCVEDAVFELRYMEGLPQLCEILSKEELAEYLPKLMPILAALSKGQTRDMLLAADVYAQIDIKTLSAAAAMRALAAAVSAGCCVEKKEIADAWERIAKLAEQVESLQAYARCVFGEKLHSQMIADNRLVMNPDAVQAVLGGEYVNIPQNGNFANAPIHVVCDAASQNDGWALAELASRADGIRDHNTLYISLNRFWMVMREMTPNDPKVWRFIGDKCDALARCYYYGRGVKADPGKAEELFDVAVKKYGSQQARWAQVDIYLRKTKQRFVNNKQEYLDKASDLLEEITREGTWNEKVNAAEIFFEMGKKTRAMILCQEVLEKCEVKRYCARALFQLYKYKCVDHNHEQVTAEYIRRKANEEDVAAMAVLFEIEKENIKQYADMLYLDVNATTDSQTGVVVDWREEGYRREYFINTYCGVPHRLEGGKELNIGDIIELKKSDKGSQYPWKYSRKLDVDIYEMRCYAERFVALFQRIEKADMQIANELRDSLKEALYIIDGEKRIEELRAAKQKSIADQKAKERKRTLLGWGVCIAIIVLLICALKEYFILLVVAIFLGCIWASNQ